MKKLLLLFCALLCLGGSRAWADTQSYTVTYELVSNGAAGTYSRYYQDKTAAAGQWCNRWQVRGNYNSTTFPENIPGVVFRADDYIISGWNSKIYNTGTSSTFTIQAPGTGIVTGYTLTATADNSEAGLDTYTKTITPSAGGVAVTWSEANAGSQTVTVTGLTANTATFTMSGTENSALRLAPSSFTMTVQFTLLNSNSDIDYSKYYYLACPRGGLSTNDGQLASTFKNNSYTMKPFAFVQSGGNYYLYSVDDNKYVSQSGALETSPSAAVTIGTTGKGSDKYPTYVQIGSNYLRTSNHNTTYGANTGNRVDNDAGNYYAIIEGGSLKQLYKDRIDALNGLGVNPTTDKAAIDAASSTTAIISAYYDALTAAGNKFFTLKNYNNTPDKYMYVTGTNVTTTTSAGEALVQFSFMPDGGFAIFGAKNQKYIGSTSQSSQATAVDTPTEYYVEYDNEKGHAFHYGAGNWRAYLHCDGSNNVVGWSTDADNTWWTIEEFELPFKVSTDFATATWYYLKMRTTKYVAYGADAPYGLTTTQDLTDNGMWAFILNPSAGIQVINRGAGSGKYLEATSTQPTMTTTATNWGLLNNGGNIILYNSTQGYVNDVNDYLQYWNDARGATDDGSTFRVEEVAPTIVINKDNGTYYTEAGVAVDPTSESYWGPTWKSTRTVGGTNNMLVLTNGPEKIGMNAKTADIYTSPAGAAQRYTLSAVDGYVITGYSITGTATTTDITIRLRVRQALTITNGESGTLTVSGLDLQTTSFTLSGANSTLGHLSDLTLSVKLQPTSFSPYTPIIEDNTTATIGYKHIKTDSSRRMTYMTETGAGVVSANNVYSTFDLAPTTAAEFKFEYDSDVKAYYIKETSSNKYVYAKDDLTWNSDNRSTTENVAALGVDDLPGDAEGKTLFQWTVDDGGTNVSKPSYYIRPKSNTNTAISVQSMGAGILGFYDLASGYDFAHASLLTWEDQCEMYYTSDRSNNVKKVGKVGYPKSDGTAYTNLNTLLSTFIGVHTYTKSDYTNLITYYDAYIVDSDIQKPVEGKAYTIANYANDGTIRYLYNNSGEIHLTTSSTITDDYKFICHKNEAGKFIFAMPNGNYLVWKGSGSSGVNSGKGETTLTEITSDSRYPLTIQNFPKGTDSYNTATAEQAFGKVQIIGWRTDGKTPTESSLIVKTSVDDSFDKAGTTNFFTSTSGSGDKYSSAWIITEADYYNKVKLNTDGTNAYASLYLPFPVTIPEGITAYAVTSQNGVTAHMEEIVTNGTLPKNTATILKKAGQTSNASIYLSPAEEAGSYEGENKLGGTVDTKTRESLGTGTTYVLANIDGDDDGNLDGIGLYNYEGTYLAKGKAYLFVAGGGVKALTFDFSDADGINTVQGSGFKVQDPEIYNLAGQRMSRVQKGVNIVNGKKVLVK